METEKVGQWAKAVGQWAGDSPYKAATLAIVFTLIGWIANAVVGG